MSIACLDVLRPVGLYRVPCAILHHVDTKTFPPINRNAISRCTGVDLAHISRIFNPKHNHMPSARLAPRIARCLGVTTEELLEYLESLGKPR